MNVYGAIVLASLLAEWALATAASVLNLRAMGPHPPPDFAADVDAATWQRTRAYTAARTRLGLVASSVRLAALLAFWFFGGFAALDRLVRALDVGPVAGGVAYVAALALLSGVLSLPFAVWSTFGVEQRFGFNRTTPAVFVADRLKGLVVAALLGLPLLTAVVAFFETVGATAWLWAWGATAAFVVVGQVIVPRFVMPWFNRFAPLPESDLRSGLLAYARLVDFPLEGIYVMDGSKRSGKGNAFFTGFGRHKRVALFDTLLARHPANEIIAITAHEVGHYKAGHLRLGTALSVLHAGVLFALLQLFLAEPGLYAAFGVATPSVGVGLVLFGLLYTPVEVALGVGLNALSRRHEYQADRFAARTTGSPQALAAALRRLSLDNLSNLAPHRLPVVLYHTHPPLAERLRALAALRAE
jgi:STE24 endopeptidase